MQNKKILLTLVAISVILTAIIVSALTVPAIGAWFGATFGGLGVGLTNLAQIPFKFALNGAAQTFTLYAVAAIILFGFAYWVWHWDIGYKLTAATTTPVSSEYSNTMRREPEEPERSSKIVSEVEGAP